MLFYDSSQFYKIEVFCVVKIFLGVFVVVFPRWRELAARAYNHRACSSPRWHICTFV